jgi:hypothetical protein
LTKNKNVEGGAEELVKDLSTMITTEIDLEQHVELFSKTVQSACRRTFQTTNTGNKISNENSVSWSTDSLSVMCKITNAYRRLFRRTRNDEALRETRKQHYFEAKRNYQVG